MSRNGIAVVDWKTWGPRVLAWLAAEAPRRTTVNGLAADCAAALGSPLRADRLQDWLLESARAEWSAIKRTLGSANGNGARPPAKAPVGEPESAPALPARTLAEFLRDKRKAGCPVCTLSPEILHCLAEAANKGTAKVPEQVEWLNIDCGARVTVAELTSHRSGRHEQ